MRKYTEDDVRIIRYYFFDGYRYRLEYLQRFWMFSWWVSCYNAFWKPMKPYCSFESIEKAREAKKDLIEELNAKTTIVE
jgi:hypothetical protein